MMKHARRNGKSGRCNSSRRRFEVLEARRLLVSDLPLAITEIMYHPVDPTAAELAINNSFEKDNFEFIELTNTGGETISLEGVTLATPSFMFNFTGSDVTSLDAGAYVLLVRNQQAFEARYGSGHNDIIAGVYTANLANGDDPVTLTDAMAEVIHDFKYEDSGKWPGRADGKGSSLEVKDLLGDYDDPDTWRNSGEYNGTPGAAGMGSINTVVINEVLSHTDPPQSDSIELHNTTNEPINIGYWYLSDSDGDFQKFQIPPGTMIPGGGYLTFDEDDFNISMGVDLKDFSLDGAEGDDAWLLIADVQGNLTHFADHVSFGAQLNGESWGRWPNADGDLYPMTSVTLDGPNSGPRVGPIVVNEIMYNPLDPGIMGVNSSDLEFIEIYNPTAEAVNLTEWRLRGEVDFDFPMDLILGAGATMVLVPFDPTMTAQLDTFRTVYGLDPSAIVYGPYDGKLDDGGANVRLQRPDEPPMEMPEFFPRLLEDEVKYNDKDPWPELADGEGGSLVRTAVTAWGNDAASWIARQPTPGSIAIGEPVLNVTVDALATNDTTPPITGTITDPAATVSVMISGNQYAATNNGDGTWSLADNTVAALADGVYDVEVTATNAGGPKNDSTTDELTIDTLAPTVTARVVATHDDTPSLNGTISDDVETVMVTIAGAMYPAMVNGDGTWTLPDDTIAALAEGFHNFDVMVTDAAGNSAAALSMLHYTADPTDRPWRNPTNFMDVDDDLLVTLTDAQGVFDDILANGLRQLPPEQGGVAPFVDVNGDGLATWIDALVVINHRIRLAPTESNQIVELAVPLLLDRVSFNAENFFIYQDADSAFNHGFPSGFFPAEAVAKINIDAACVDDSLAPLGCSSDLFALDTERGTVLRVTLPSLAGEEFIGLTIEEPEDFGSDNRGGGYDLTGATHIVFDARTSSTQAVMIRFEVAGRTTPFMAIPAQTDYESFSFALDTLVPTQDVEALDNVHKLFTVVTDAMNNPGGGTVLLDNIRLEPAPVMQQSGPAFPLANETFGAVPQDETPIPPDQAVRNLSTIYESSLTLLALLGNDAMHTDQIRQIADSMIYALEHDHPQADQDGRGLPLAADNSRGLHDGYFAGDLALFNDQVGGALQGQVRLAGFSGGTTLCGPSGFCLVQDGATGGNNAFAVMALVNAFEELGDEKYLNAALEIGSWIDDVLRDDTDPDDSVNPGFGGYFFGFNEGEPIPPARPLIRAKSIENNADIFAAFSALAVVEDQRDDDAAAAMWQERAKHAGDFVMRMYDPVEMRFNAGTLDATGEMTGPGLNACGDPLGNDVINCFDFLDSHSFTVLALAGAPDYHEAIDWRQPVQYMIDTFGEQIMANGQQFTGFSIVTDPVPDRNRTLPSVAGIAWEFTGQAVAAMRFVDQVYGEARFTAQADFFLNEIARAQMLAPFADGRGLVASTLDGEDDGGSPFRPVDHCLTTPFQCIPERVGLAATNWAIFADRVTNIFLPPGGSFLPPADNGNGGNLTLLQTASGDRVLAPTLAASARDLSRLIELDVILSPLTGQQDVSLEPVAVDRHAAALSEVSSPYALPTASEVDLLAKSTFYGHRRGHQRTTAEIWDAALSETTDEREDWIPV